MLDGTGFCMNSAILFEALKWYSHCFVQGRGTGCCKQFLRIVLPTTHSRPKLSTSVILTAARRHATRLPPSSLNARNCLASKQWVDAWVQRGPWVSEVIPVEASALAVIHRTEAPLCKVIPEFPEMSAATGSCVPQHVCPLFPALQ